MTIESLEKYLDTVAGYVYDNDKLVTYKWLSKELEVHVNIAKQILWEFVQRRKDDALGCTYLLMGTLHGGGVRVEVVKEEDLDAAKKKFSNVISEHIYSLQKALPDIGLLAIAGEGDPRYSAIKCNECVERTDEELHVLRWAGTSSEAQIPQRPSATVKANSASEPATEDISNSESKADKKNAETKKNVSSQKKGFNNLFGKAPTKKSPPSTAKPKDTSPKETTSSSPKKKAQKGGLHGFLEQGKNQQANKKSSPPQTKVEVAVRQEVKTGTSSVENGSSKPKKEVRGKKRNRSKDTKPASKRLKRVTIQSDSSDSELSNEEASEPEPEPEPEPERQPPVIAESPSPPRVKQEGGKRKVLKKVDKTFEEDGFLVTKKVHVYESCSEEEPEPAEVKKSTPPESRTEAKGKKSTKQTTLMNFFKKS